ncbi:L,D-transpeptidase family protein [Ginsengibacter hankyongi]|uniref:L,D-transpeptidase family protein n=1 Tax=Ginsengibacter hankyongi TaxID=2607284 RepID=A0A5J5IJE3_9BACT|nr:L,D-transpeptidase family protein [Ginsengibacter hankyongi]KAA9041096.1 L,D-transpeptidase family protein [Ginsengibacter hankyongi]
MIYNYHFHHKLNITAISIIIILLFSLLLNTPHRLFAGKTEPASKASIDANGEIKLLYPQLVKRFYEAGTNQLFWFSINENSKPLRQLLKSKIDNSASLGLKKEKYHLNEINKYINSDFTEQDSIIALTADRIFTDAAIAYCKDVYQGNDIGHWMLYDEISLKSEAQDNQFLLTGLSNAKTPYNLLASINSLEPKDAEYLAIKKELQSKADSLSALQKKQLTTSLQFYRWMHHFKLEKWIVVNIPSATLRYYEYDSIKLRMKVVVGKPSTRTPRFAAHCNEIILYPYWNVPSSIARNELLPQFRRHPGDVDALNMQVLDLKGNIIDHHKLNWRNYSRDYFPFQIRQSTGCDNSLGVVKFNLTSPFSVYLHDTNNKNAFLSGLRYYSHGCIRIQEPIALASYLLPGKIDSTFLESCLKDQQPITLNLPKPVPIFVIYQTVETSIAGKLQYFKDVYSFLK